MKKTGKPSIKLKSILRFIVFKNFKLMKSVSEIFRQLVAEATKAETEKKVLLNRRRADADELRKQIVQREKERWGKVQADWEVGRKLRQEMKAHDMKVQSYMNQKMSQAE